MELLKHEVSSSMRGARRTLENFVCRMKNPQKIFTTTPLEGTGRRDYGAENFVDNQEWQFVGPTMAPTNNNNNNNNNHIIGTNCGQIMAINGGDVPTPPPRP